MPSWKILLFSPPLFRNSFSLILLFETGAMNKRFLILLLFVMAYLTPQTSLAQCSICTKTAQQMGEKPAKALNTGIIYLAFAPLAICGFIGYRWWKHNKD
jgi:hypothetical protein